MLCKRISPPKRKLCAGDLKHSVTLQIQSITPPATGSVDYGVKVGDQVTIKAAVKTVSGETIFDGTNTEQDITHHFYLRYQSFLTFENWLEMNAIRYRIVDVENIDQANQWHLIRATKRGTNTLQSNLV